MVVIRYRGRLGNQMCEYAMARIIAEKKGYQLEVEDNRDGEGNSPPLVQQYFPNAGPLTSGTKVTTNSLSFGVECSNTAFQYLDMDTILKHNGQIYLGGYWQKHYYYTPHLEEIKKWFEYDDSRYKKPDEDDIVVLIRLDDYLAAGISLPMKIYIDIINMMENYNRCIIVTDSPKATVLNELLQCLKNVSIFHKGTMADFTMLKCSKRLILSQSSFGFWASFLGNQIKVYAPLGGNGWWKYEPQLHDIDLVPTDKKHIKVKV